MLWFHSFHLHKTLVSSTDNYPPINSQLLNQDMGINNKHGVSAAAVWPIFPALQPQIRWIMDTVGHYLLVLYIKRLLSAAEMINALCFNRCFSISIFCPWYNWKLVQHNCPSRLAVKLNVSINVLQGQGGVHKEEGVTPPLPVIHIPFTPFLSLTHHPSPSSKEHFIVSVCAKCYTAH